MELGAPPITRPWSGAPAERDLRQNFKIGSAALMLGTAVFFPWADDRGGVWFRSLTLALFFLAVPVFHALHLEPFIRTGRFTIPTLVLLMLLIVLSAGPSRETLLPWLLFILTVMSFITVGVDEALPYLRRTNDDDNRSMRLGSERSTTVSTRPLPSNPRSQDPNDLRFITGPPSQVASRCSGSEGSSGINLHDVRGSVRPYWDESIRRFWRSQDVHVVPGSIPIEPSVQTMDIDQALDSQLSGISDDLDSGLSTRPFLHEPVQRSD